MRRGTQTPLAKPEKNTKADPRESTITTVDAYLDTAPQLHVKYVQHVNLWGRYMPQAEKQNLTVTLSTTTIRKAKILAAKRSTSISGFLAGQIEALVDAEDAYESAQRSALGLMERGFHLGGTRSIHRDTLHER